MSNYIHIRENFFKRLFSKKDETMGKYFDKFLPLAKDLKENNDIFLGFENHVDMNNIEFTITARNDIKNEKNKNKEAIRLLEFRTTNKLYDILIENLDFEPSDIVKSVLRNKGKIYLEFYLLFNDIDNLTNERYDVVEEIKHLQQKLKLEYNLDLRFNFGIKMVLYIS